MTNTKALGQLELVWWLFTVFVVLAVLFPIYTQLDGYPFYVTNVVFIVAFITLSRYLFLLAYTFLAKRQALKVTVICLAIPFIFYLVQGLHEIQIYIDEHRMDGLLEAISSERRAGLGKYIRSEMLLFGVGAVISSVLFPLRLLVSIWKQSKAENQ